MSKPIEESFYSTKNRTAREVLKTMRQKSDRGSIAQSIAQDMLVHVWVNGRPCTGALSENAESQA